MCKIVLDIIKGTQSLFLYTYPAAIYGNDFIERIEGRKGCVAVKTVCADVFRQTTADALNFAQNAVHLTTLDDGRGDVQGNPRDLRGEYFPNLRGNQTLPTN